MRGKYMLILYELVVGGRKKNRLDQSVSYSFSACAYQRTYTAAVVRQLLLTLTHVSDTVAISANNGLRSDAMPDSTRGQPSFA